MTDTLDIKAKAPFPAGALSNFAMHAFTFDGVACASMEGFLQSLKIEDVSEQTRVCGPCRPRGSKCWPQVRLAHPWHTMVARAAL